MQDSSPDGALRVDPEADVDFATMMIVARQLIREARARGDKTAQVPALDRSGTLVTIQLFDSIEDALDPDLKDENGVWHQQVHVADDGTKLYDRDALAAFDRTLGFSTTARAHSSASHGRTRSRERRSRPGRRRSASSSSTSSADPGDPDAEQPSADLRLWAHPKYGRVNAPLAAELNRIAARLRARGGVG